MMARALAVREIERMTRGLLFSNQDRFRTMLEDRKNVIGYYRYLTTVRNDLNNQLNYKRAVLNESLHKSSCTDEEKAILQHDFNAWRKKALRDTQLIDPLIIRSKELIARYGLVMPREGAIEALQKIIEIANTRRLTDEEALRDVVRYASSILDAWENEIRQSAKLAAQQ